MAANVGTSPVQFYLGANPVSAYLGATAVARTLYFNGAVDNEWTELGNWSTGSLPTAGDSVIATASITASGQTVANFTLNDPDNLDFGLVGTLTVTGNATFNNAARLAGGTVTGNATFNGSSFNDGTVGGNATFNDGVNFGTVTGTATFTGSACNDGGTAGTFVPDPPPSC